MKLEWSKQAREDLQRLYSFLADKNIDAAEKALDLIFQEADLLTQHPEIGRLYVPDDTFREWPFQFGRRGYVIRYEITEDTVIIYQIWHSRENR